MTAHCAIIWDPGTHSGLRGAEGYTYADLFRGMGLIAVHALA
jgi:hypothetical protein